MNRPTSILLMCLFVSLAAALPAAAQTVLCAKEKNGEPKGAVRVRADACRSGEIELSGPGLGAMRAELEAEIADLSAQVSEQSERIAAQAERIADAEALSELLAVQQNHAEERGSINDFAEASFTSVVEVGTVAPNDGFLMVWAVLNAEYDLNSDGDANVDLDCRIAVDGVASSITVDQEFARVPSGTNSGEVISVNTVAPVAEGARSAALECRSTGSGMAFIKARSLTTLFVSLEGEAPRVLPVPRPLPLPVPLPSAKAAADAQANE